MASASIEPLLVWEGHADALQDLARGGLEMLLPKLPKQPGDFGFARLAACGRFVAVRSAGGLVAVYHATDGDGVWLATSFEDLIACRFATPRPDRAVQALWAEGNAVFPDGRTFVEGVHIVPRGHALHGDANGCRLTQYWDPRPEHLPLPSRDVERAHVEELRSALLEAIDTLDAEGPNLLTLSGGVDSSCLAHLAARRGFPLATLTFVAPRSSPTRERQLSYVDALLRELGIERAYKLDAEDAFLDELFCRPLPALFFCPHPALRVLPDLAPELAPRVLFNGHFADEVCGYSQRLQDWIRHTPFYRLLDPTYPRPSGVRDVARWFKRRALERLGRPLLPLPTGVGRHFDRDIREDVAEWAARERQRLLEDPRPLRELSAWCRLDGWIAMHWECCARWGIRPLQPFFTRRVLELAHRCHPVELFGPGTKKLLRRALGEDVPSRYLHRPDKGHWRRRRSLPAKPLEAGLPDDTYDFLSPECRRAGTLLTGLQHRQVRQIVLFAQRIKDVRREGSGRIIAPNPCAEEAVHSPRDP